ncbi:hypothetical protein Tco_0519297 [Tanacetum coccineum]
MALGGARKPHPCGLLLDILTRLTNAACDEPPRAIGSILGRHSPKGTQAIHACCFVPRPHIYSTPTCIVSHASEPWQVAAAVAAVCSAGDEKVILVRKETKNSEYETPVVASVEQQKEREKRGLSFISSPLHAMKSQSQIQSSAAVKFGGVTDTQPRRCEARLEDMEVEIDTLYADAEDKELLILELQDSLAAAENEISILQIRAEDAENRCAEDHEQIQKILAYLGL